MFSEHLDPLRVAMVTARALPMMGGTERHVHEVASRLGAMGVDVTVLTTDRTGELASRETTSGYQVLRWRAYPASRDFYYSPGLLRHLRNEHYDVVHVQGVHTMLAPAALAVARRRGVPTVLTFHTGGHSSPVRRLLRPLQWRVLGPLLSSTSALIAVSDFERRTFASIVGVSAAARLHVIRNGSDPLPIDSTGETPEGRPLLVSVGRLERYKGHHRVLRALPTLLAREPDTRLVIVGEGPYEDRLRSMARELGVDDRVSFSTFGPDRRAALGRLVADADVLCLLSEYEAHPVAVMEAVGAGTNALVANTSGLSELGESGLVTTIDLDASAEELAEAVLSVASESPKVLSDLPDWDGCADRLHRLYLEVAV